MASHRRENGYTFTNDEIIDFWLDSDGPGGEVLVEICNHESPGTPLHMPIWSGYQLFRLSNGDFLEQVPDASVPHDFGQLIFRGAHLPDTEITVLIIDLVTRWQLETPVAFAFHFDSAKFGDDAETISALRARFWSTWSGVSPKQQSLIDQQLCEVNPVYASTVDFFRDPRNSRFRDLLESATNSNDLSPLYKLSID